MSNKNEKSKNVNLETNELNKTVQRPHVTSFKKTKSITNPISGIEANIKLGDFTLIRRLGVGGMGEVWLAHQKAMDRDVALKILSPTLSANQEFVSRFVQEVKISAKLQHPNIVVSYYAGIEKGIHYLAISYIDGHTLNDTLLQVNKIPEDAALNICLNIAHALNYAWKKCHMVHRDIKPGNIMISSTEKEIYLMDMGISKNLSENNSLTMTGAIVGTPYYMSPEQARGDLLDFRADIYALGATIFHLLTGKVPYNSDTTMGILTKVITEPVPYITDSNPKISDRCAKVIKVMMAKEAQNRQQSWDDVIKHIKQIIKSNNSPNKNTTQTSLNKNTKVKNKTVSKIVENKNNFPCPSCNINNKIDALFCTNCGESLSKQCPECSEKISINMNFCLKCGTDIQTLNNLEALLKQATQAKKECKWIRIMKLSKSLPKKSELSNAKLSKLLTQILIIKKVASKEIEIEDSYQSVTELAKKYSEKNENVKAFSLLQDFLFKYPKNYYAPEIRNRIKELKKISYQGPILNEKWIIPGSNIELVPIKEGEFTIGSSSGNFLGYGGEKGRKKNEGPAHQVTLSQPFWISQYVITIENFLHYINSSDNNNNIQWNATSCPIDKAGKDKDIGRRCWGEMTQPMIEVNWNDASNFCQWLTHVEIKQNRIPAKYHYRLPTEAEWEYCCRAGTTSIYNFQGGSESTLHKYAWIDTNSNKQTHPVGQKLPNEWGLYDMHGNVWEWCQDIYREYSNNHAVDPCSTTAQIGYVRRGGSWINSASHCRSAYRNFWEADCAFNYLGFRIVLAQK
jgi:formylglycine-generating enzyme required for sulfatase activity